MRLVRGWPRRGCRPAGVATSQQTMRFVQPRLRRGCVPSRRSASARVSAARCRHQSANDALRSTPSKRARVRPALEQPRCDVPPVSPPGERCVEVAVGQSAGAFPSSLMSPSAPPFTRCVPSVAAVGTVLSLELPCRSRGCEPSEFGLGAVPSRCRHLAGVRRRLARSNRDASLRSATSARVISALCCHRAGDGALRSFSSSTRVRAFGDRLRRGARPFRVATKQSDDVRPSISSSTRVRAFGDRLRRGARPFRVATEQSDGALPSISSSPRVRVVGARLRRVSLPCRHEEDGALPSTSSGPRCVADVAIDAAGASLPVRPSTRQNRDVRPVDLELKLPNRRAGACERSPPGALSVGRGPARSEETSLHLTVRFPATSRRRWRTTFARLACHRPP
mgnify:CR=1 FL=1